MNKVISLLFAIIVVVRAHEACKQSESTEYIPDGTIVYANPHNVCFGKVVCDGKGNAAQMIPLCCADYNYCTDDLCDPVTGCFNIVDINNLCWRDDDDSVATWQCNAQGECVPKTYVDCSWMTNSRLLDGFTAIFDKTLGRCQLVEKINDIIHNYDTKQLIIFIVKYYDQVMKAVLLYMFISKIKNTIFSVLEPLGIIDDFRVID